ncbi:MAG: hypothetical protein A4E70_01584 [Syntrophus sp. PtaU1.Bin005]|jgi:hypothetical protein|uniref:hypothetical protein n=1 Tax=Syntrophus TaxID=43773 RepID=UPI0009CC10E0|nr:MAG: hypothetical protein A4E69_01390 [Syntrophus sp. PtaB.Bin138]OPY80703.1 MAG: hypothetical protein A4E70_01584 [Syntrophus sp. PtaU1.Bin005]
MKKSLIVLLVAAAVVLSLSFGAGATCTIIGTIKHTIATSGGQYIDVAPSNTGSVSTYVYRYWIPNSYSGMASAASSARGGHQTVRVVGSAASCPASGTIRSAGTATTLYILMNY